jgi:RNA polymerase sigma factor (sigma-70 family)
MRDPEDIHDEWLVLRCQDGDAAALAELVERWQPRLLRHAHRLTGTPDGAGDVVQQAWIAIIRGLDRLSDAARFRRWAYQIVTYKCADWVRERQRERAQSSELADEPALQATHENEAANSDRADDIAVLRSTLQQISPDRRAALSMFYLEQMSLSEIAEALSLPLGTVKSRLHYAKQELKAALERKIE